jgi:hypothetical protein
MNRAEWRACAEAGPMIANLSRWAGPGRSDRPEMKRKMRLYAAAAARAFGAYCADGYPALAAAAERAEQAAEALAAGLPEDPFLDLPAIGGGTWCVLHPDPLEAARMCCDIAPRTWADGRAARALREADLVREIFGDSLSAARAIPEAWRTADARAVARAALKNAQAGVIDPTDLLVLADCLEEAGCDSPDLLRHLRGFTRYPSPFSLDGRPLDGPHVLGCWAADLVLGLGQY